jgi:hypothetical protein
MKLIKNLSALACVLAVLAAPAMALADDKATDAKKDTKTCCEKAKADGKECTHKCCVAAKADGKVCEKCNPPKDKDKNAAAPKPASPK